MYSITDIPSGADRPVQGTGSVVVGVVSGVIVVDVVDAAVEAVVVGSGSEGAGEGIVVVVDAPFCRAARCAAISA